MKKTHQTGGAYSRRDKDTVRRLSLLALMLLTALMSWAQGVVMQSFEELTTDLTANTEGTIVKDQNGKKCALIKVETTQTGFSFDVGTLGVVKTEQKVGEVWVYVPEGVKRITISHQQLGTLRNQDLGQSLRAARTYLLRLTTGTVQTTVVKARTTQYVVFQLEPQNAVVMLDNEMLATADGTAQKLMPFGTYDYRVQAPDYLPEVGKVTVNDPKQKAVVQVKLRPNFSRVTLTVDNQAEIWVNGERKGADQWTGNLGAGTYIFETRKAGHRPVSTEREIAVVEGGQTIRLQAPQPIYGEADINSTPGMADIYIDGKKVGQTPQLLSEVLVGDHQLRLSRQGYADYTATLRVSEGETASLAATLKKQEAAQPQWGGNAAVSGTSLGGERTTITVGGVTFDMIRVEGQGSPFYIGETEVTQALWEAVMGSNPSHFKGANRPVEQVSWNDCQEFIRKLNQKTGKTFRLPKEAEWEYAAKGGNKSRGYEYSGCNSEDELENYAWYDKNAYYCGLSKQNSRHPDYGTHTVKTKKPNELGLYDMSGNVWEWCEDLYRSGSSRVYRGGSWFDNAWRCRVSYRGINAPDGRYARLGLRLAL